MRTSLEGRMAIASHEGIVQTWYKDSKGIATIGIGHTAAAGAPDPKKAGKLTIPEVLELFRKDLAKYEADVSRAVKVPLAQHEFDALVSFHYNTGAIGKATFVKKLNTGDRAGAIKGIMDWRKPPEIIGRRTAERDLFAKGVYPPPFATLLPATPDGRIQWGQGKRVDLREVLGGSQPAQDAPKPTPAPQPESANRKPNSVSAKPNSATPAAGIAAAVVVILAGAAAWFGDLPCNILGVLCQ